MNSSISKPAVIDTFQTGHSFVEQLNSIKAVAEKPWGHRIWVLQEHAVSGRSKMFCGAHSFRPEILGILFQDVFSSFSKLRSVEQLSFNRNYAMLHVEIFVHTWQNHWLGKSMKLGELIYATFSHFQASEPRDNIFALIGLVGEQRYGDLIDYHLTIKEVFTQATTRCLLEDGIPFHILSLVGKFPPGRIRDSVPSWVPDFSFFRHFRLSFSSFFTFSAAGDSLPVVCVIGDTLSLVGIIVDTVRENLDCPTSFDETDWDIFRTWYRRCRSLMNHERTRYSGESPNSTWWRVMVCDLHSAWSGANWSWNEVLSSGNGHLLGSACSTYTRKSLHHVGLTEMPTRVIHLSERPSFSTRMSYYALPPA
jgi:hypothetical protein